MKRLFYIPYTLKQNVAYTLCDNTFYFNEVYSTATKRIWMDRNLGANALPATYDDTDGYGMLFQWGRLADGHQCIDWRTVLPVNGTTESLAIGDVPDNNLFITPRSTPYDWRNPQNDNLWQGVLPINDVCPVGYRLPTAAEINAERITWNDTANKINNAFAGFLKIPTNGYRDVATGNIMGVGTIGGFWSSTVSGIQSKALYVDSITWGENPMDRAMGLPVRCIKIMQPNI